jgi:hypothetical protein
MEYTQDTCSLRIVPIKDGESAAELLLSDSESFPGWLRHQLD